MRSNDPYRATDPGKPGTGYWVRSNADRQSRKAGRVESATDPAPYSMMETVIILKPQTDWPKRERWYSKRAPNWLQGTLGRFWPDHMTTQELIYSPGGLNEALTMPGISNAWTMPIKARIDMLTTRSEEHTSELQSLR